MRLADFNIYRDLLLDHAGADLQPNKSFLLASRLSPIAKRWGFHNLSEMTLSMKGMPDKQLIQDIVQAVGDTETAFFDDFAFFEEARRDILPGLAKITGRKIRIWCAACASGQEAYTMAILLAELGLETRAEILATDLNEEALAQARHGQYSHHQVQSGLPTRLVLRYFTQKDNQWQARREIASLIRFEAFNLLGDMTALGVFDLILCNNVLGGFAPDVREKTREKLQSRLVAGGILHIRN